MATKTITVCDFCGEVLEEERAVIEVKSTEIVLNPHNGIADNMYEELDMCMYCVEYGLEHLLKQINYQQTVEWRTSLKNKCDDRIYS